MVTRRAILAAAAALAAAPAWAQRTTGDARVYWVRRNDPPAPGSQIATWFAVDAQTRAVRWLAHVAIAELSLTPLEEAYLRNDLSDGFFYVEGTIRPGRFGRVPTVDARGRAVTGILHVHRLVGQVQGVAATRLPLARGQRAAAQ